MKKNLTVALFLVFSIMGFNLISANAWWPVAPKPIWGVTTVDAANVRTYHLTNTGPVAGDYELLDRVNAANPILAYPTDVCGILRKWNTGLFLGTPGKQIALRCIGNLPAGGTLDIVVTYTDPVGYSLVTLKAKGAN